MGINAFNIILVIGLSIFFILKKTLKKIIKSKNLRNTLTWVGTIILTLSIYTGSILIFFSILFYEPAKGFDREKWFSDKRKRYEMRDDIITSGILKKKNRDQVIDLIGSPDVGTESINIWKYDLGTSTAGFGLRFNTLVVTFEKDIVTKVEKIEIVD